MSVNWESFSGGRSSVKCFVTPEGVVQNLLFLSIESITVGAIMTTI